MNNVMRNYVHAAVYNTANVLILGGIIQTFLLEGGVSEELVSFYVSALQIVQVISMLAIARPLENMPHVVRPQAWLHMGQVPMFIAMLAICLIPMEPMTRFHVMLLTGIVCNVALGILSVVGCKLPYAVFDMRDYGHIVAISGVITGLVSMGYAALISGAVKRKPYFEAMTPFVIIGGILMFATAIIIFGYEEHMPEAGKQEERKKINLFRYKPFYTLFIPNLIRGYATGTFELLTTVGYFYHVVDSVSAGYMVIIANVLTIVGCFVYDFIVRRQKAAEAILVSCLVMALSMAVILLVDSTPYFVIIYAIGFFFRVLINYATPVCFTQIIDYEVIGQYSSWRMMLYFLGSALAGFTCIAMLNSIGGFLTMLINAVMLVIVGFAYYLTMAKMKKEGTLKY